MAILCAKVALVPVVFDRSADIPFGVVKALFSHALAYVLLAIILALLIRFGRSFLTWSPLHLGVVAFLGVNVIASAFALDPVLALYGTHPRMIGLGTIADGVVLYFAVVLLVRTRRDAVAVVASLLASSVVVLAYEFVQWAGRDPFLWNIQSAVRPFSTLGQTTSLAEYLTVLAVAAIATAAIAPGLRPAIRTGLLLYTGVLVIGLVVTETRSALLGLATGAFLLVVLTWFGHPDRRARLVSMGGTFAAAAVVAIVLIFTPLGSRLLGTVDVSAAASGGDDAGPRLEESAQVRLAFYRMSLDIVHDRPLFGYGPDNFVVGVPKFRTETEPQEVQQSLETSAHGWLSQVAATSGLAGVGAFLAVVMFAIAVVLRGGYVPSAWVGAGMLAAFLGAGLTTVNEVGTEWLFWLSLGVIGAATARPLESPETANPPSRRAPARRQQPGVSARSTVGYLLIAAGVVMAFTTLRGFDAARNALASQQARLKPNIQQAIELGMRATSEDPQRGAYWDTLGLAYVGAARVQDAVSAFRHATDLAPYDYRYSGDLARAYLQLFQNGDPSSGPRAREIAERIVGTDPNNPQAHLTRAVVMQVTGDLPEAMRSIDRAMVLDRFLSDPNIFLTATQVYRASGRPSDAVEIARRAIAQFTTVKTIPIRLELARALIDIGRPGEALIELDAVLALNPNDQVARQLRAQIQGSAQ